MTGFVQSIITVLLFIFILGALVVIHELGHFVTARLMRVKVLEFGVGQPCRQRRRRRAELPCGQHRLRPLNRVGQHDRHVVADEARQILGEMHHGVVLDVGVAANNDPVDVAAQDGVVPDAGMIADFHIANDAATRRDKGAGMNARGIAIDGDEGDIIAHGAYCFINRWRQRT